MDHEFMIGNLVRLKSGDGPPSMTIQAIFEHEKELKAHCAWVQGTRQLQSAYLLESLMLVPPPTILASSSWPG